MYNVLDACITITREGGMGFWSLEIESFLGPVKWHRADRRVSFGTPEKLEYKGGSRAHSVGCGGAGA
jgi:hypothetical protein